MSKDVQQVISAYVELCDRLKTTIEGTRRRSQRVRAYVDYVIGVHDLQYSVSSTLKGEKADDTLRGIMDGMSSTVEDLLSKTLDALDDAVIKERGFVVYSADDDDLANKVSQRCDQCIEDIEKANGVLEKIDAAEKCISDLRGMLWKEVERGLGGGKGGH